MGALEASLALSQMPAGSPVAPGHPSLEEEEEVCGRPNRVNFYIMLIGQKGVKYGLQVRSAPKPAAAPAKKRSVFGDEDSDEEGQDNVEQQIARQAARKQTDKKARCPEPAFCLPTLLNRTENELAAPSAFHTQHQALQ